MRNMSLVKIIVDKSFQLKIAYSYFSMLSIVGCFGSSLCWVYNFDTAPFVMHILENEFPLVIFI